MQTRLRYLAPMTIAFLAGCSENRLSVGAVDAAPNTGSGGAPSGSGGLATSGTGGAATSTGDAGGAVSGPCGAAACLTSLFQTCVPEGDCAMRVGSTVFYDICYANGVTVTYASGYDGVNPTSSLSVARNGLLCYRIEQTWPPNVSAGPFVITDGNGNEVATAFVADKFTNTITVTCKGESPTEVDGSCLHPVSNNPTCNLQTCPTSGTGGLDGGTGVDDAAQDKPTPDAPEPDADAGGQSCGDAACGPGQACALVMGGAVPQCFPPTVGELDAGACSAGFVLVPSCRVGGGSTYYQPGCTEPAPTPRCYDLPDACGDFCSCLCPSGGGGGCYPGPGYYLCGYP